MTDPTTAFSKMVPGFDFLQGLVKNAGAALPGVGQWIAPTMDPEVLEKRISELRTVQFWLEQNARLLGTTIQALEVQRMTLSTLKTMNVSFADLTESLKIRLPEPAAAPTAPGNRPSPFMATPPPATSSPDNPPAVPPGVVDPMQWWGALTQQFTELAANAMKDGSAGALVKQGLAAASETMKKASEMPMAVAQSAASAAQSLAGAGVENAVKTAAKKAPRTTSARKPG